MFLLTKKKVEEIGTLLKWMEEHEKDVMVTLIESERHQTNPKRVFKVFSYTNEELHFIVSKEDETYNIPNVAGVDTNGRYLNNDSLHHILMRLFNHVSKKFEQLMEVNKELEDAINLFKIDE